MSARKWHRFARRLSCQDVLQSCRYHACLSPRCKTCCGRLLHLLHVRMQVLRAGQQPLELSVLLGKIETLAKDIEAGRAAVLDAHRAVLDCGDSAIARVCMCHIGGE